MKTAFLTDIHLNDKERLFLKEKRKSMLRDFVENKTNDIQQVVFWGDIFDTVNVDMASESANFFFWEIVKKLLEKGIKVDILVGNHERLGKKNVFAFLDDTLTHPLVSIYKELSYRVSEDKVEIFIPFIYSSDFNVDTIEDAEKELKQKLEAFIEEIKPLKKPIIVYNHNCMGGTWFEITKETNLDLTQFKEFDLVLGGHVHKHKNLSKKCLYVGSFMRSFIYENEDEGYYVYNTEKWKVTEKEYIENSSYAYQKVDIYGDQEFNFEPGNIYNITFKIGELKDNFFISNTLRRAEEVGAFVLKYQFISIRTDINKKENKRDYTVSTVQTNEEILTFFVKEEADKKDIKEYLKKLRYCSVEWVKTIADAQSLVSVEDIEEKKVRKTIKRKSKFEKKQDDILSGYGESATKSINTNFVL